MSQPPIPRDETPASSPSEPLPQAFRRIHAALGEDAQLVLVGGAVRDRFLGKEGGDWDLASALMPQEVMERARAAGLRAIPTGLQHGTVTLMASGHPFEITTFRGEGPYLDGRRPESVILGVGLAEDLARRDFTINAMALPAQAVEAPGWRDQVVDPFGGRVDLEAGLLRAVGDPLERFREDGLRAVRACRFVAQLGFRLDEATRAAIPQRLEVTAKVAVERVMTELTKLLCGKDPAAGLESLRATGLLDLLLPELSPMVGCLQNRFHRYPVWEHALEVTRRTPAEPDMRWAGILHDAGKPAYRTVDAGGGIHFQGHESLSAGLVQVLMSRLRASHDLTRRVSALVLHHGTHPTSAWSDAACRRFLKALQEDALPLERWATFRLADQSGKGFGTQACLGEHQAMVDRLSSLAAQRPPLALRDLALNGGALMRLAQRKGGPWLGQLQAALLEAVLEDPSLNTSEGLGAQAREWLAAHP